MIILLFCQTNISVVWAQPFSTWDNILCIYSVHMFHDQVEIGFVVSFFFFRFVKCTQNIHMPNWKCTSVRWTRTSRNHDFELHSTYLFDAIQMNFNSIVRAKGMKCHSWVESRAKNDENAKWSSMASRSSNREWRHRKCLMILETISIQLYYYFIIGYSYLLLLLLLFVLLLLLPNVAIRLAFDPLSPHSSHWMNTPTTQFSTSIRFDSRRRKELSVDSDVDIESAIWYLKKKWSCNMCATHSTVQFQFNIIIGNCIVWADWMLLCPMPYEM